MIVAIFPRTHYALMISAEHIIFGIKSTIPNVSNIWHPIPSPPPPVFVATDIKLVPNLSTATSGRLILHRGDLNAKHSRRNKRESPDDSELPAEAMSKRQLLSPMFACPFCLHDGFAHASCRGFRSRILPMYDNIYSKTSTTTPLPKLWHYLCWF